jgi:hypothetical protein
MKALRKRHRRATSGYKGAHAARKVRASAAHTHTHHQRWCWATFLNKTRHSRFAAMDIEENRERTKPSRGFVAKPGTRREEDVHAGNTNREPDTHKTQKLTREAKVAILGVEISENNVLVGDGPGHLLVRSPTRALIAVSQEPKNPPSTDKRAAHHSALHNGLAKAGECERNTHSYDRESTKSQDAHCENKLGTNSKGRNG